MHAEVDMMNEQVYIAPCNENQELLDANFVITGGTKGYHYGNISSHASNHLCQIWKESIQNCICYRADMTQCAIFQQFILQSHCHMTLKIYANVKSHCAWHVLLCFWLSVPPLKRIPPQLQMPQIGHGKKYNILALLLQINGWMTLKI